MLQMNESDAVFRARNIRLVVLDVDGVLTDGSIYVSSKGEALQRFNVQDGLGIELLINSGIEVVLLTARESPSLRHRASKLGVNEVIGDAKDKLGALVDLSRRKHVPMEAICYAGDDLLDVPCLQTAGLAVTVSDANDSAKSCSQHITMRQGGQGAVRELAEYILSAQRQLELAQDQMISMVGQHKATVCKLKSKMGIIIPSRFGAVRLSGKPLRLICGKPLIVHVYENALRANADFTIVATDDLRIAEAVEAIGGDVELTSSNHLSGTDRLAEVVEKRQITKDTIIINIQGDEPLLDPALVTVIASALVSHPTTGMTTIASPISTSREIFDANVVKVVIDHQGYAQYFSRAAVPWLRDSFPLAPESTVPAAYKDQILRHVGLYGYRSETLLRIASLPSCHYERAESLEQLRALYWGIRVHVSVVEGSPARGVNTEEDLKFVEQVISDRIHHSM